MVETFGQMATSWPFGVFLFIVGLCVGSFLNVCIHRLPAGQSIVRPRSHCTSCLAPIAWYDNLPVASYLVLGGRCRRCGARFSVRYLIIELVTGLVFVGYWAAYFKTDLRPEAAHGGVYLVYMVLAAALLVSGAIDLERREIYTSVTNAALLIAVGASFLWPQVQRAGAYDHALPAWVGWGRADAAFLALVGAAVGGGIVYLTRAAGTMLFGREAMGMGDVYLMAAIGAALGWEATVLVFFIAPFVALGYVFAAGAARAARRCREKTAGAGTARRPAPTAALVAAALGFGALFVAMASVYFGWDLNPTSVLMLALALFLVGFWLWRRRAESAEAEGTDAAAPAAPPAIPRLPVLVAVAAMASLLVVPGAGRSGSLLGARVFLGAGLALFALAFWLMSRQDRAEAEAEASAPAGPAAKDDPRQVPYGPFLGAAAGVVMLLEGRIVGHFRPGVESLLGVVWRALAG
jgi:leader peptidase (prepilin peptidase)/N-methyltransferase